MYKLMVVDDEPRQSRALANIIRQLRPEYEILTACDGQEALDLLQKNSVHILFTDIRMPVIDGLQLVEKINELKISLKIIILSGYGEFEYAKKAIQFGVSEYLVKPISKTDLESVLVKVENILEKERYTKILELDLKKKLDNSLPVYLERQLNRWVAGKSNEEELREIKTIFPYHKYGLFLITSFRKPDNFSEDLYYDFVQHSKFSMKEVLDIIGHSISFLLESEKCQMATVLVCDSPINSRSYEILKILQRYIQNIKDRYGVIPTIGVSDKNENLLEDITEIFGRARSAIEYRFFSGVEKVIYSDNVCNTSNTVPYKLSNIENEISEAVRLKDKTRISEVTTGAFENINKYHVSPGQIKEDFAHILLDETKNVSRLIDIEEYNALIAEIKMKTLQCEEYGELWHYINDTLFGIIDITNDRLNDKNGILINKCKKFIDQKYMEDISLEIVAQKYFFNSSYFSKLFKSYTGLGFSEYLLMVRIQSAKKILKATEYSMADVACRVGFKDPTYFNRVFKKEVGISPLKYRQMNENG
jgi:two-component system response regulator YesN